MLDEYFLHCPWPVPPHAILRFVPIEEEKVKHADGSVTGLTSEGVLRRLYRNDKILKKTSAWNFVNGPKVASTVFDDGTQATGRTRRHYVIHQNNSATISTVDWANFLNYWSSQDLDQASSLMRAPCVEVLSQADKELFHTLQGYRDVMMLPEEAGLTEYQDVLRRMYRLGLINLSLTPFVQDNQRSKDAVSVNSLLCAYIY